MPAIDATFTTWPLPRDHQWDHGSHAVQDAPDVDVEDQVGRGLGLGLEGAQRHHTGVVDEDVDAAGFLEHLPDELVPRVTPGDVQSRAATAGDSRGRLLCDIGVDVADPDIGTVL